MVSLLQWFAPPEFLDQHRHRQGRENQKQKHKEGLARGGLQQPFGKFKRQDIDQIGDGGERQPRNQHRHRKGDVGQHIGTPGHPGTVQPPIRRIGEIPDDRQIGHEDQQTADGLKGRKGRKKRRPGQGFHQVQAVDMNPEDHDRHDGEAVHQGIVVVVEPNEILPPGDALLQPLKPNRRKQGEDQGQAQHRESGDHRAEPGLLRRQIGGVDQKNDDEVDEIGEHSFIWGSPGNYSW
ncbi:MAG: hypothetical protein ACOCW9_02715 [Thermodesulfobacteriota bacterium]